MVLGGGDHAEDSVRCFIWVLQEQASLTTRWCPRYLRTIWIIISGIVIAVQLFAVSMVKTEMLSSDANKSRLDKSREYFSMQSSQQQQQQQQKKDM